MYRSNTSPVFQRQFEPCSECTEACQRCLNKNSLYLQHEIEELKAQVVDRNNHLLQLETDLTNNQRTAEQETSRVTEELNKLRDRYDRLFDSHKKLQKCNHDLECKLLSVVERYETEKKLLFERIEFLNNNLLAAKVIICDLQDESERNRNDCNLAVQLLQCRPSNFVSHKLGSLPPDLQLRVKSQLSQRQLIDMEDHISTPLNGGGLSSPLNPPSLLSLFPSPPQLPPPPRHKVICVPMSTYPPTAIVYSVSRADEPSDPTGPDAVPSAVIARVLAKPDLHGGGGGRGHPRGVGARVVICRQCFSEGERTDRGVQTEGEGDDGGRGVRREDCHWSSSKGVRSTSSSSSQSSFGGGGERSGGLGGGSERGGSGGGVTGCQSQTRIMSSDSWGSVVHL